MPTKGYAIVSSAFKAMLDSYNYDTSTRDQMADRNIEESIHTYIHFAEPEDYPRVTLPWPLRLTYFPAPGIQVLPSLLAAYDDAPSKSRPLRGITLGGLTRGGLLNSAWPYIRS